MSAAAAKHDPTSVFVREVIALYHEAALAEARFPDLDLEVLLAAERALQETQLELERCEAQLAAARAALVEQLEAIECKAERALAYARVYATGDLELTARLAEMGRKKPAVVGERAPPRKRGRPKKAADGAELFAVDGLAADGGGEPEQPVVAAFEQHGAGELEQHAAAEPERHRTLELERHATAEAEQQAEPEPKQINRRAKHTRERESLTL